MTVLVARIEVLGEVEARGAVRFRVDTDSTMRAHGGRPFPVLVENFSRGGFLFVSEGEFAVGTLISIGLSGAGTREAQIIWRDGNRHGCEFLVPLPQSKMTRAFKGADATLADLEAELRRRFDAADAEAADQEDPDPPAPPPAPRDGWRTRMLRRLGVRR